jgi:hypothetical protein
VVVSRAVDCGVMVSVVASRAVDCGVMVNRQPLSQPH